MATASVPELKLHLVTPDCRLWRGTEAELAELGWPEPYWAFAWAGGEALARHVLDRPADFADQTWLDVGGGSGLVALAAAKVGAQAQAVDLDPVAEVATRLNAEANRLRVEAWTADALAEAPEVDGVFLADLTYEATLVERVAGWCRTCRDAGVEVLLADPGRGFVQRSPLAPRLQFLSAHQASADVGEAHRIRTPVYRLR